MSATPRLEERPDLANVPDRMREVVLERDASRPRLRHAPVPEPGPGEALVRTLYAGIDGTDEEVVAGIHGEFPEGRNDMVLGHECLGVVVTAPETSTLSPGDHVVPLVRHGCGHCDMCRRESPDLCAGDDYVEHGIKGRDGFLRGYWTDDAHTLVKAPGDLGRLAVLTEPLSIDVKALEVASHVQRRIPWFEDARWDGRRALLIGTGSLGSLATLLLLDEGMEVWAMDRRPDEAASARWLRDVGATHVNAKERSPRAVAEELGGFDLVIEATGAPQVVFDGLYALAPNGVMVMLGVPGEEPPFKVDGDAIQRRMVLHNQALLGSVNSNARHFRNAMERLRAFRDRWGSRVEELITHTFPPERVEEAFETEGDDVIKKVVDWTEDA